MIKSRYKNYAENLLVALNIFIIFLLLFGSKIAIPQWLQPVGRLHPVIIHFPIVILIMAMVLEFFRFKEQLQPEKLFNDFITYIWLAGAIFAAVTATMGLFLSKEAGYEGGNLLWHKWFGVSVVFVSSAIYQCRNAKWYSPKMARLGAVLTVLFLVIAGHFGADISHGENFLLAPVWHPEKEKVSIERALVFRDVVEPVFENKCISCHNPDRTKGGLMLIDEKSIRKGGKDGKLFIAGQPQLSLLLQRIHLPEEEKTHMPPAGKPQLSADELKLLYLWIKENAAFNKKVIDMPQQDSLRVVAATFLKPAGETEEKYDFAAVDEKLVKKLNNNYRVIYFLANGSPALGVNIYNKKTYQSKILQELNGIKKQVISLDLNKMPVKDADLKTIGQFENLRSLNLNFTDITGNALKDLAPLKYLRSLSLAGDKLNPGAINQISILKSLTKVALWDTGLPAAAIAGLQKSNKHIDFITGFKDDGNPIKLNGPQVKNTGFVFTKPLLLELSHPIKGVYIRYTTNGADPDSVKSMLYKPGITISQNTVIKAKAYKPGWLASDIQQVSFYKSAYTPDSISFIIAPDEKYSADGAKTLIDKDLGGSNFGNGKWVASQKGLAVYMQFNHPVSLHTITLNCMRNTGSQIFLPVEMEVWGGNDAAHLKLLSKVKPPPPQKKEPFEIKGMDNKLTSARALSCFKIIAMPQQKLPQWDTVKKQHGWVFVDEIFLN